MTTEINDIKIVAKTVNFFIRTFNHTRYLKLPIDVYIECTSQ